jgi:hypothetical protein
MARETNFSKGFIIEFSVDRQHKDVLYRGHRLKIPRMVKPDLVNR